MGQQEKTREKGSMKREIYQCDQCGAEQQATANHWFVAYIEGRRLTLQPLQGNEAGRSGAERFDLCGEACAIKQVSEFVRAKA
jgi:hypothetical protein